MPFINLIQEQRLAAKRTEKQAELAFYSFVGSIVAVFGICGFILFNTEKTGSQEAKLKADVQKLSRIVSQIDRTEKEYVLLQPRLKTLQDAQAASDRWCRVMQGLTTQTPANTWLTGVKCTATDPTKPISVGLVGMSHSQEPVAEFMMRQQNSKDFENVLLKYTQEQMNGMSSEISFEVDADLKGTAEETPIKDKSKEGTQ